MLAKCDSCFTFPCLNGATCRPTTERDYQCLCAPGYHGKLCESAIDACYGNPCRNGATCKVLEEGRFRYVIYNTSITAVLSMIPTNIVWSTFPVATAPPATRATAVKPTSTTASTISAPTTRPVSIWSNPTDVTASAVSPVSLRLWWHCLNTSRTDPLSLSLFVGPFCDKKIQFCTKEFNPCRNGATCVDRSDNYTCVCPSGFSGENCTVNNDDCLSHMCQVIST